MKIVVKVSIDQLGPRMAARARQFPMAVRKGMLMGAMRCLPIVQESTRDAPPANPGQIGMGGAVDTGNYLQAWRAEPTTTGARIFNLAAYSSVIEFGRRPGKRPPISAIARWAKRRLGLDDAEAKRAAYPIAIAIARRGLLPRHVATSKLDEMSDVVTEEARKAVMAMMAHP